MRIAIGLPNTIPGISGEAILDWARRADAGPFSSLASLDRLVYPNYEPLITLTAAAAVTTRVRLMTTVLLAPLRDTAIFAKQAASLDALSGGRLTLGLGVGGREDDFQAAGVDFHTRGRRFAEQLEGMRRVWAGEPLVEGIGPIGPVPARQGGPEVLIGGQTPKALSRAARWGEGYIAGGAAPEQARQGYQVVEAAWKEAGRPGKPRFVGVAYYGLGEDARERAGHYIRDYYTFLGPVVDAFVGSLPATPDAITATIQAFADVGADEMVFWPCIPDLDQVDRLAALVP